MEEQKTQQAARLLDKRNLALSASGKQPNRTEVINSLDELSYPPTDEELSKLRVFHPSELPQKYQRENMQRVFVNRSLRLDRIKWIGFDMDYTLAVYKEPEFESLTYDIAVKRLITMGYPESIRQLKYDPSFPIRGLFLDNELGNLLKADSFGNIILCVHGRKKIKKKNIYTIYPSGTIQNKDIGKRFYMLTTLFALPEACLYADLVEHFESRKLIKQRSGQALTASASELLQQDSLIHSYDMDLSFKNLFQDVREVIDYIHNVGELKKRVVTDLPKYIQKDPRTGVLLHRLRKSGAKTFLLTNSQYHYTNCLMSYLLNDLDPEYPDWKSYFDVIIVGAQKPSFFSGGNTLRKVDLETGALKVSSITCERFEPGQVYNGGSLGLFNKLVGTTSPNQVLYVGDHIFSDIIVSKKVQGWRNMLVVRELDRELRISQKNQEKQNRLATLEFIRAEIYRGMNSETTERPDMKDLRRHMEMATKDLDQAYNKYFGALFRSGSKQTYFSMQVQRYADLYAADFNNLLNYPLFYTFIAPSQHLAHELPNLGNQEEEAVPAQGDLQND